MSITSARNFIEKSGCGYVVGIVLAVIMLASIVQSGSCSRDANQQQQTQANQTPFATIGKQSVYMEQAGRLLDQQMEQFRMTDAGSDPAREAVTLADTFQGLVSQAIIRHIADERNIQVSDEDIRKDRKEQLDTSLLQARMQMEQLGMVKKGATEAEFAEAYKKAAGTDLAEIRKQSDATTEAALKDPVQRQEFAYQILSRKVLDSYKTSINLSDEELKKGYDTYVTKRVFADAFTGDPAAKRAKMEQALAEIKSGKITFEQAMEKYSEDKALAGKKKSDSTIDLPYSTLTFDPVYEPMLKMKPGDMTGVLNTSTGPAIFKIMQIVPRVPSDFEKNKESIRTSRIAEVANRAAFDDIQKRLETVQFKSEVIKTLVMWRRTNADPRTSGDKEKFVPQLKKFYDDVMAVTTDSLLDERFLELARFGLYNAYYNELKPDQQVAERKTRIERLMAILAFSPNVDNYIEAVNLAIEEKDATVAFDAMKASLESNAGSGSIAESRHKRQRDLVAKLVNLKMVDAEQQKSLEDELKRWEVDLYESIKLNAESNQDFSDSGESLYKETRDQIARFSKAGYLTAEQTKELNTLNEAWKGGVFGDLKQMATDNTDYSSAGQEVFSDINARLVKAQKAGYVTAAQAAEIQKIQDTWRAEKKKADEDAAANTPAAPAPGSSSSALPNPPTGAAPRPSGGN